MASTWKKATSPINVIDDGTKDIFRKHAITSELARAVREIQLNYISKGEEICGGEEADSLCSCVEAAFIHGIKHSFAQRFSSVFTNGSDKIPEPDFWPMVMVYTHKQVLTQISQLNYISNDIGKCRSWLRLALNEGSLKSYVEALILDKNALGSFYRTPAYVRDSEQMDILKHYLEGLEIFKFQLPFNCSTLNSWNPEALQLAGIWDPPVSPEPIMPAIDVLSLLNEPNHSKQKKGRKIQANQSTQYTMDSEQIVASTPTSQSQCSMEDSLITDDVISVDDQCSGCYSSEPGYKSSSFQSLLHESSSPRSLPGFEHMFVEKNNNLPNTEEGISGNKLLAGWSSSFDSEDSFMQEGTCEKIPDSQSYDSLLQSYIKNQTQYKLLAHTPELEFLPFLEESHVPENVETSPVSPPELSADLLEFEIVPKTCAYTSKDADELTTHLMTLFDKICPETGLDKQHYKCSCCTAPIGMIYGDPFISYYDGQNYCAECHANEEFYIPSRVLYNWDFRKHPVAKQHKEFLIKTQEEPLFDIRKQNPQLYTVVQELVELQLMRTQLNFLRSYLFTCREQVAEQLRKLIWPREYLYEHIHIYSLADLLQVPNRVLIQTLQKAIAFASKHVLKCPLCSQKGFICELCNSVKIIYPFETDTTFHCEDCLAVYHSACMNGSKSCKKCDRLRRRKENSDLWACPEQEPVQTLDS